MTVLKMQQETTTVKRPPIFKDFLLDVTIQYEDATSPTAPTSINGEFD